MNKHLRELMAKKQAKLKEAKSFMQGENKDLEKANALMDEVEELAQEIELAKAIYEQEKNKGFDDAQVVDEVKDVEAPKKSNEELFVKAVKTLVVGDRLRADKDLVSNVDAQGGYTVPHEVSTKVNKYKEVHYSLEQEIDVVHVSTPSGETTWQKKSKANKFVDVDEAGRIANKIDAPQFERQSYAVKKRAGYMPVTAELLSDSDANIMGMMTEWLAQSDMNTTNAKVLSLIATKEQVDLVDIDGIKKALNVTLGQAYKNGAKIYTNDDGLNYLDTLKDANGRPLLNADPTAPANLQLRCGVNVLPIKVLPNQEFATTLNKVPFIVGDLKEFARKYVKMGLSISSSTTASIGDFNSFEQDMTLLRAIVRDDYKVKDADAIVNGYITVGE